MSGAERYAVRVVGRGVVTAFNGEPITTRELAEQIVRSIELMYGEKCVVEKTVLALPVKP